MIEYLKSPFGLSLIFRVHGSAVYRSVLPALTSVGFTVFFRNYYHYHDQQATDHLKHPYAIGILIATLTFSLVFRVQQGYARYWEACTAIHQMMSKWVDAATHTATFHMQSSHYDRIKPPSFHEFHDLNRSFLTRSRERRADIDDFHGEGRRLHKRSHSKSIERVSSVNSSSEQAFHVRTNSNKRIKRASYGSYELDNPMPLEGQSVFDGNWGKLFPDGKSTFFDPRRPGRKDPHGFAGNQGGRTPPLFLQELTHLCSLSIGVALSTLRNDIEGAESPLDIYDPGSPWPAVDPKHDELLDSMDCSLNFLFKIKRFFGFDRCAAERTRYNAKRPLPVIGGVSDAEIIFLQTAKGPYAKTQLCAHWLLELVMREHLAGSLGAVGAPIISRIVQFVSDGMGCYNQARKVMFIPFPFPHAQLSVFYVLVSIPTVGLLMDQYCLNLRVGCILSFLTVMCLSGIHEVARELENPFRNIPNEIPLVTLQAQANEALIVMYSGYHPDLFWGETAKMFSSLSRFDEVSRSPTVSTRKTLPPLGETKQEYGSPKKAKKHRSEDIKEIMELMRRQQYEIERLREELGLREAERLQTSMSSHL